METFHECRGLQKRQKKIGEWKTVGPPLNTLVISFGRCGGWMLRGAHQKKGLRR